MSAFAFCPICGSRLDEPASDGGAWCSRCGRSWYRNPIPTAGCVIVEDGRALVTLRGVEPEKGRYDVPGGFLGPAEHPVTALKREVREELGVEIEVAEEDCLQMAMHKYGARGDWILALGFKGRRVSGEPRAADDVADFRWIDERELEEIDFAWEHDRELVRKAFKRAE